MNNLKELTENLSNVISDKFHEQYPEIFVKPNTKSKEEYNNSVEGYKLYIDYLNAISRLYEMRNYKISGHDLYSGNHDGEKLIEDVKNCEDILKFCFFNIPL